MKRLVIATAIGALFSGTVLAQQGTVQRNVNQQERIEQGLKSGQLNTQEASRLEAEQSRIQRDQARALSDGKLSPAEKARLDREQNQASRDINRLENNKATGNPNSASSKRMQADVQRNINQQTRIEQGVKSGQLTNRETARLEAGQSRVEKREARAGADGHVGSNEQARIQSAENRQSARVHREKHDVQTR
jgi:hypothetical protein